ncbi:hypothetical protein ACLOJK_023564 [Asimina triloba]
MVIMMKWERMGSTQATGVVGSIRQQGRRRLLAETVDACERRRRAEMSAEASATMGERCDWRCRQQRGAASGCSGGGQHDGRPGWFDPGTYRGDRRTVACRREYAKAEKAARWAENDDAVAVGATGQRDEQPGSIDLGLAGNGNDDIWVLGRFDSDMGL